MTVRSRTVVLGVVVACLLATSIPVAFAVGYLAGHLVPVTVPDIAPGPKSPAPGVSVPDPMPSIVPDLTCDTVMLSSTLEGGHVTVTHDGSALPLLLDTRHSRPKCPQE